MPLLQVRDMPEDLYEQLSLTARRDNRSIAQETIVLLRQALMVRGNRIERRQAVLEEIARMPVEEMGAGPDPASLIREDRDR